MALLGRSNDHDETGDDVVSRDGDAEQEHGVEEASQVVDRVLKNPRRRKKCPDCYLSFSFIRFSMISIEESSG